jgi:hypothetical protein
VGQEAYAECATTGDHLKTPSFTTPYLGKSVSTCEITEFIPQALRHFDLEMDIAEVRIVNLELPLCGKSGLIMHLILKESRFEADAMQDRHKRI